MSILFSYDSEFGHEVNNLFNDDDIINKEIVIEREGGIIDYCEGRINN